MSGSASSQDVTLDTDTVSVDAPADTEDSFEVFPDERADGPLSSVFRTAQRFRRRMQSD